MVESVRLLTLIDQLGLAVSEEEQLDFGACWAAIKHISNTFRTTRFPTRDDRATAWAKFQAIVAEVKAAQADYHETRRLRHEEREAEREQRRAFAAGSEEHLGEIVRLANRADRAGEFEDLLTALVTFGASYAIEKGLEIIFGELNSERDALRHRSDCIKEANSYFKTHKGSMVGRHKQEAFIHVQAIQERLNEDWDAWKTANTVAREQRQREYEERQERRAERERKQAEWREGQLEFIERQEGHIERWGNQLDRQRDNLTNLHERLSNTRNPDKRDQIEEWIEECEETIETLEEKVASAVEKRDAALEKLKG